MNLLSSIKSLLKLNPTEKQLSDTEQRELNQAIVELMIEMVKADFVELYAEKTVLAHYLSQKLGLSKQDINDYIEAAEMRTDFSISLETQTNVINNYLGTEQKQELLRHLWSLAIADNEVHLLEKNLFYKAGQLMGVKKAQLDSICLSDL
ncbi:TerB family tellurite resistance protein [Marinicella sp. S1101]|uniref:tellurite resistance TerB family protein n=1 Tax=Marinicella marina TaxID=2996016 RepID=UPI002260B04D|nr:TerB family tellurite resistance protein [Marinicella marina]MCX7552946.1 TerB family tellurite resistance protein [Marinicella marina]MDJ1139744.1 TerB family tellurite resistance protein [Marinicella marina]